MLPVLFPGCSWFLPYGLSECFVFSQLKLCVQVDSLSASSLRYRTTTPKMNPAAQIMCLRQGDRPIEDYVKDFINLAHLKPVIEANYKLLSCPDPTEEAAYELSALSVTAKDTACELSNCSVAAARAILKLSILPVVATKAVNELSVSSVSVNESVSELSACPVSLKELEFDQSVCPIPTNAFDYELSICSVSAIFPRSQSLPWAPVLSAPPWWSSAPSAPPWWSSAPPWCSSALLWWSSAPPWPPALPARPQSSVPPLLHGPGPTSLPLFRLHSASLLDFSLYGLERLETAPLRGGYVTIPVLSPVLCCGLLF